MINGMYLSTMGAMVQSSRHETVANNLANASTAGFKPDYTIYRSVPAESLLQPGHRSEIDPILERTGGGVWLDRTVSNFASGPMQSTGNPLDLALINDPAGQTGFFMLRPPEAQETFYSRDGRFHLNAASELVNTDGAKVLGPDGGPIVLEGASQVRVNPDGTIINVETNEPVGQVGVVRTAEARRMRKLGDNLWSANGAAMNNDQRGVQAETIELSATSAVNEMANMIESHRTYETNMKFISIQDETLGETVRRLGSIA